MFVNIFILCKHQSLFIIYLFIIYNNNKKTYMFVYHFNLWQFLWLLQFQYLLIIVMSSFLFADLQPTDQPRQRSCKKKSKEKIRKFNQLSYVHLKLCSYRNNNDFLEEIYFLIQLQDCKKSINQLKCLVNCY